MIDEIIVVQTKKWFNNMPPYLEEGMLNDNQQALEKSVNVFEDLRKEWDTE